MAVFVADGTRLCEGSIAIGNAGAFDGIAFAVVPLIGSFDEAVVVAPEDIVNDFLYIVVCTCFFEMIGFILPVGCLFLT